MTPEQAHTELNRGILSARLAFDNGDYIECVRQLTKVVDNDEIIEALYDEDQDLDDEEYDDDDEDLEDCDYDDSDEWYSDK